MEEETYGRIVTLLASPRIAAALDGLDILAKSGDESGVETLCLAMPDVDWSAVRRGLEARGTSCVGAGDASSDENLIRLVARSETPSASQ